MRKIKLDMDKRIRILCIVYSVLLMLSAVASLLGDIVLGTSAIGAIMVLGIVMWVML